MKVLVGTFNQEKALGFVSSSILGGAGGGCPGNLLLLYPLSSGRRLLAWVSMIRLQPSLNPTFAVQFAVCNLQISFHFISYLSFPREIPKSKCKRQYQDQVASKISQAEYVFLGLPKRFQQWGLQHSRSGAADPVSLSISSLLQTVCWIIDTLLRSVDI